MEYGSDDFNAINRWRFPELAPSECRTSEISYGSADGPSSMHKYLMSARTGVNDRRLARNVFYYEPREIQINPCTCIREADANNSLRLMMKLAISVMTAISLSMST